MTHALPWHMPKTIALVGLMGAGKSSIGRRLAQALGLPFVDADAEIEFGRRFQYRRNFRARRRSRVP